MLAASAVLVSHSWAITLGRGVPEPLIEETGYSLGVASVIVFFAVSGYFITKSFDRRTLLADFLLARVARLFPALIVALLLTAFVIGPVFTTLPVGQYFGQRTTWLYAPQNALLVHQQFALPGVFANNPFAGVANGSLWTLKYEVACYGGVVIAGLAGLLRARTMPLILIVAAAATVIVPGGDMALSARVAVLCAAFALGAGMYVYRHHVPISGLILVALAVVAVLTRETRLFPLCYALLLGYGALVLGFADFGRLRAYNRLGDYSYGTYVYAFPIGQATFVLMPTLGPWGLIAVTFPITLVMAIISWMLIENPALTHRHRLAALIRLKRGASAVG